MKKKIFTLLMALLMVAVLIPCALAINPPIEAAVEVPGTIQVRKEGTDASWASSTYEVELSEAEMAKTVDFRCELDTRVIKNAITNGAKDGYYDQGLALATSIFTAWGRDAATAKAMAEDIMREWPVTGQFVIEIVYPNILTVPADYTKGVDEGGVDMYGFNDEAKNLFTEVERTLIDSGDNKVLTIKIEVKDADGNAKPGIAEQTLYEGVVDGTYLGELVLTVKGVTMQKFSNPVSVTGQMIKGTAVNAGSYTLMQIGYQTGDDDMVPFYTNKLIATLSPKQESPSTPGGSVTKNYKVTFNVDGNTSMVNPIYTSGNVKFSQLTYPEKVGYVFDGWYFDSERTNKVTEDFTISKNIVLYGHMTSSIVDNENHFAYIIGYPEEDVRPLRNITREEVAMIFYRLLKDDVRDSLRVFTNDFTDVKDDRWSNVAISTMANGGFIKGYPDGTFGPAKPITRAEFATIATRFAKLLDESGATFSDIAGHWSESYVLRAATAGWIAGYPDGTFLPEQLITRAEAMTIINRVLMRSVNKEGLHADTRLWIDMVGDEWYYYIVLEATNSHNYVRQADGINENWTEIVPNKTWD